MTSKLKCPYCSADLESNKKGQQMKKDFYIIIDLANDGMICAMLGSEKLARRWIALHDTSDWQSTNNFRIIKILGALL